MATTSRVKVDGLQKLGVAMRGLSKDMAGKVARAATGAGAKPIKKAAVRNIETSPSIDTRALHDNVIVKSIPKGEREFSSEHIVTVRGRGKKVKHKDGHVTRNQGAPHAHFVEFGTVNMPAEPFLQPAYEHEKGEALNEITRKLAQRIEKVKP